MDQSIENNNEGATYNQGPPRSIWVAAFLSFLGAGLGHIYAGHARRGLMVYAICFVAGIIAIISLAYIPSARVGPAVAILLVIGWEVGCVVDAVLTVLRNREYTGHRYQRWWVYVLVLLLAWPVAYALTLPFRTYWLQAFSMPTGSMSDTIMAGDRILVEMRSLIGREIRRGDVVIYNNVEDGGNTIFSKRVVGLPGDIIEFKGDRLIRNGELIDEPYVKIEGEVHSATLRISNFGPITVPEDKLFMAGDHRRLSYDSRSTGSVPLEEVIGHVMVIYWSQVPESPKYATEGMLRAFGIDENNPPGKKRWGRIGQRVISSQY